MCIDENKRRFKPEAKAKGWLRSSGYFSTYFLPLCNVITEA